MECGGWSAGNVEAEDKNLVGCGMVSISGQLEVVFGNP
jgi:hypothetical protein